MKRKLLITQPVSIFLFISWLGILIFFVRMTIAPGDIARWVAMEHTYGWQFLDFYRHIAYAGDLKNIYANTKDAPFPPLAYCFFHILYILNPDNPINPVNAINWHQVIMSASLEVQSISYNPLIFLMWNITLFSLLLLAIKIICKFPKHQSFLLFASLIFSAPFMYGAIEMGNPVVIVLILLLFSIHFSSSHNIILREISLILIAIAAGWKIYPAIFGFIYLREHRYKEAVRLLFWGILFFFAPFIFTGGSIGFQNYIDTLKIFQNYMNIRWTDVKDFYTAAVISCGGHPSASTASIIQIFSFITLLIGLFIAKNRWHALLFASCIMIVCISNNYRYVSIYAVIPLLFLFAEHRKTGRISVLDYVNIILFALTFTIPIYGYMLNIGECDMYIFLPIYLIIIINTIYVYKSKLASILT